MRARGAPVSFECRRGLLAYTDPDVLGVPVPQHLVII